MRNAVSEVTSYIYIFGIVMVVLAVVFVQINSMVEEMKRSVLSQSLEQSFRRIQYIVHSVAFGDVPAQVAEIELQDGVMHLSKNAPSFIIAFVNNSGNITDCRPLPQNFKLYCLNLSEGNHYISSTCSGFYDKKACILNRTVGELKYQYRDWSLSMEAGAIFSKYTQENYSKLLYEPRILLNTTAGTSKYLVITIPVFDGNISAAGYGRFRFTIEETNWSYSRIENVNDASIKRRFENIYIIIKETEHQNSWCEFFGNFDIFNLTLPEIGRNCKNAKNPSVIIERGDEKLETIFLFKELALYS